MELGTVYSFPSPHEDDVQWICAEALDGKCAYVVKKAYDGTASPWPKDAGFSEDASKSE